MDEKEFQELVVRLKAQVVSSSNELAGLILPRVASRVGEELAVTVAHAQRVQGEAEQAAALAQAEKAQLDKSIAAARSELGELDLKRGEVKAALDQIQRDYDEIEVRVRLLREEASRHRRRILDIDESDEEKLQ